MTDDKPIKQAIAAEDDSGGAFALMEYDESIAMESALHGMSQRVDAEADPTTPDPARDGEENDGGVIRRTNEFMSKLGPTALEAVAIQGLEISRANKKRADELFRNKFPLLTPRFQHICEDCGIEYDEEVDECEACGSTNLREPSVTQKHNATEFFRSVNQEGQSLRELYKNLTRDEGRLGLWTHVIKKEYAVSTNTVDFRGERLVERGEMMETTKELVRADPKRLKPVVDENGRIGGWWWACPIHRGDDETDSKLSDGVLHEKPGRCPECGAELREVHYAEVGEQVTDQQPAKVFFEDEVVTFASFEPRLNGKDGVSPVDSLWLPQAILQWMRMYAGSFFDTRDSNRYPGKLLLVHTSNKDQFERSLDQAQDEAKEDPYAQGILYNEVPFDAGSVDKAQVIDMMSDKILGQQQDLKKDLESAIRTTYGLTDAQESELDDAGGLNNEGLQLEINDRDKAALQQDLMDGPLQQLMDSLGFDDWEIKFVPPKREGEELRPDEVISAASQAESGGVAYEITDGQIRVADTDGVVEPEPEQAGGGAMPMDFAEDDSGPDEDLVRESVEWLGGLQHNLIGGPDELHSESFSRDDEVPDFVFEALEQALDDGAIYKGPYEAPGVSWRDVEDFLREKLDQPQGWSQRSLFGDFADRMGITQEQAAQTLRPQVGGVLNHARKEGYQEIADEDDKFKHSGPLDDDNTEACREMMERTNPRAGGEPVSLDEYEEIFQDVQSKHFPEFNGDDVMHYECRHTLVEHYD